MNGWTQFVKRTFDIAASFSALAIFLPIWVIVTLVILLDAGRPVLYSQERIGKAGTRFRLMKFRTMKLDSDKHSRLTTATDVRITRTGHFLRKFNLDEIPQLVNVLRGHMSIVGPRPEVPEFVDLSDERWKRTLKVRPGLTYEGTLYFRRQGEILSHHDDYVQYYRDYVLPIKLKFASRYADEVSFWKDLRIIFATAGDILIPGKYSQVELPESEDKD